jgi:hypothetical protein
MCGRPTWALSIDETEGGEPVTAHPLALRHWLAAAGLVIAGGLGLLAAYLLPPGKTPPGQPPLVSLSPESLSSLKEAFNAANNRTRVIAFLSPT